VTGPSLFQDDNSSDPANAVAFVKVVVERGIESRGGQEGLTYSCPTADLVPEVGERVTVPLGRSGKPTGGMVIEVGGTEILQGLAPSKIKPLLARSHAKIPADLIGLARWMGGYYVCPLGMVLSTLLPAAVKHATGAKEVEFVKLSATGLAVKSGDDVTPKLGRAAKTTWEKLSTADAAMFAMPIKSLLGALDLKTPKGLKDLAQIGLIEIRTQDTVSAAAIRVGTLDNSTAPEPTPQQRIVIEGIGHVIRKFGVHLIRGITGAGKTEVYLRLIERVLIEGCGAIVLVPEISLTPQTATRFIGRFGTSAVAVLHSGLTAAQRHREWARVASGAARVVVGARSAVFAPMSNPGLIVIDEEHDGSYKQDQLPRYNARDVAIKRAHGLNIPVVLGSATPSLESWHNATSGKFSLWELTQRAGGGKLPRVDVVDMREERRKRALDPDSPAGGMHQLGPTLERAIDDTLRSGGQSVLFINRRGFAHHVMCPDPKCGFVLSCDLCDANLVLHKGRDLPVGQLVKCHHCQGERLLPAHCPTCRKKLNLFGGGTQRVEDEICRKFAVYGIREGDTLLRLDSDAMRSANDYFDALERFGRGQARILLGTQMIAKGLDFPGVKLVGVIDADTALNVADFRAEERTFQLLSQVSGRAGRADDSGRVIIQTNNPELNAVQCAASHDYVTFAQSELEVRRQAQLPPITRMARIVSRDERFDDAESAAKVIADFLRQTAPDLIVRGPAPCVISRIAGQFRFETTIIGPGAGRIQSVLAQARASGLVKSDANTAVDIDPTVLL
jgi:primosomal protein N' (replication factor Y)